ncbi:MAG: SDR family NAD(P)-dependent oxidoreductase [Ilumatobacter sp.]|uniref:SDR family NAD(P)-dependent oxidoreductase n=1 Tax=Ilumatobacter sp. TaxID=1967498 RepID=UPI0032993878
MIERFDHETTTDDVLDGMDLSARRFAITGTSAGLGEEATRALASRGASVLMLARDDAANRAAAARVRASVPDAELTTAVLDLADLASVRACAAEIDGRGEAIDVLINNAGVMACPFGRTADGFETQFGTNHLGHFELTRLLMPVVLAGDEPRIVCLSSSAHDISDVDLDDPNFEHTPYDAWIAYGRSKSANALHALGLSMRHGAEEVTAVSVHPGAIRTSLGRHLDDELMNQAIERGRQRAAEHPWASTGRRFKTVEQGAATEVWAATAPGMSAHHGGYLADCGPGVLGANPGENGMRPWIADVDTAQRLWELSERLVT